MPTGLFRQRMGWCRVRKFGLGYKHRVWINHIHLSQTSDITSLFTPNIHRIDYLNFCHLLPYKVEATTTSWPITSGSTLFTTDFNWERVVASIPEIAYWIYLHDVIHNSTKSRVLSLNCHGMSHIAAISSLQWAISSNAKRFVSQFLWWKVIRLRNLELSLLTFDLCDYPCKQPRVLFSSF